MISRKSFYILIVFSICFTSCTKYPISYQESTTKLTENQINALEKNIDKLPMTIRYFDEKNNRHVDFDIKNRTVEFNKSWNFSNPQTNTIYAQGGGIIVYVSSSSILGWGMGSGQTTSTVTAGNTTLNVNTLCLAVDASAYAAMFGSQTGTLPIDGISCVMGIDGDFGLLANSSSSNFSNYFNGLAYYLVYDFQANGNYDVVDWLGLWNSTSQTGNNFTITSNDAFAYIFSFNTNNNFGAFYFSENGDINVNGGNMTFNGNYWGIEANFSIINPNQSYTSYPGSGTMGCN